MSNKKKMWGRILASFNHPPHTEQEHKFPSSAHLISGLTYTTTELPFGNE